MRRQAFGFLTLSILLILTACSSQGQNTKSREDTTWNSVFEPFYNFNDLVNQQYDEEFKESATSKAGLYNFYIKYLNIYFKSLENIQVSLSKGKEITKENETRFLDEALLFMDLHLDGINYEIEELTDLVAVGCPDTYFESGAALLKRCNSAIFTSLNYAEVPLFCTFVKMSTNFSEISDFSKEKVSLFSNRSARNFDACRVFDQSHLVRGYPRTIGDSYVFPELQSMFDSNENRTVIEIAEGLYAYDSSASLLDDAIDSSWFGNCAPYKQFERKLSEYNLILGSIKPGKCKN